MVRYFAVAVLIVLVNAPLVHGEEDPVAWYSEVEKAQALTGVFPKRLVFTKDIPKTGEIAYHEEVMGNDLANLGFFQLVDWRSAAWTYKLNRRKLAKQKALKTTYLISKADTVIDAGEQWSIFHDGFKENLVGLPSPEGLKPENISSWLMESLGWDGVVLAVKGSQVLVGSTVEILSQPEIQALAIEKSANRLSIEKKGRKGSGLLSLQASKNGLGIFDIVFLGKQMKTIPVGTKLIIEKKTK